MWFACKFQQLYYYESFEQHSADYFQINRPGNSRTDGSNFIRYFIQFKTDKNAISK